MSDRPQRPEDRSPQEKLRIVNESSRLNDTQLGEFLRREGVHEEDLNRWREDALGGLAGAHKGQPPSKRLRELERELKRKEKLSARLGETAGRDSDRQHAHDRHRPRHRTPHSHELPPDWSVETRSRARARAPPRH